MDYSIYIVTKRGRDYSIYIVIKRGRGRLCYNGIKVKYKLYANLY
jgi:hypothetical protein